MLALAGGSLAVVPMTLSAEAIPVELVYGGEGWQLLRAGKPYLIRGAGGDASMQQLAAAGGNSIRTWGSDDIRARLDAAHALGLSVTVGIWLGHERHGFDYGDPEQVAAQFERVRKTVEAYRNHPAVLLWGLGNEMEGFGDGDSQAIWEAVNKIALMVKELDPKHPTMTVTAEIGGGRISAVQKASGIDIHGINTYAGASSVARRYLAGGGTKPYVITEFGPPGAWESEKTPWGAPYELTSTDKAEFYRRSYAASINAAPGVALGSYAFLWGHKMEATATWFGMFLPDGASLGAVDVMTELWSGRPPADRAPVVRPLVLRGQQGVDPGEQVQVAAVAADPDGGTLQARWILRPEPDDYLTGGDYRQVPAEIADAVLDSDVGSARVKMPTQPGPYRLYYYVYDEAGRAATATLPLLVEGERRSSLPLYVYRDGLEGMPWVPSGWMGSIDALQLDGSHKNAPYEGTSCLRLRFTATTGWAGVAWQHPPNNWGDQDGGLDMRGARYLELYAKGEYGGERIGIGVGLIGDDKPYPDSVKKKIDGIELSNRWQRYRIPLSRADLQHVRTGFVITVDARQTPVTVYLDAIRFAR